MKRTALCFSILVGLFLNCVFAARPLADDLTPEHLIAGADKEIVSLLEDKEVPLIGRFTFLPQAEYPLNRHIFYLLSGIKEAEYFELAWKYKLSSRHLPSQISAYCNEKMRP